MCIKLSIMVLLLSIAYSVMGASVAVNVTDAEMSDNNSTLLNSTMTANASDNILKARQIDLLQLNVSDSSLNSTGNSTHLNASSLMDERESGDEGIVLDSNTSSETSNSSDVELSPELNSPVAHTLKVDNITTRDVAADGTHSDSNSTNNGTANPWSALPLFRNLNSTLHNSSLRNSSDSSNSSQTTRDIESPENLVESRADEDLFDDGNSSNGTEKADHPLDDSSDDVLEDEGEDDETGSTKKPCTTVSCFISRGCSDTSCSQEDN
ncbi:dentin sialophosphoprotein isoform X1 [Daphnia magna]|uniref:dentin sialophosphoprotein isoform X1 n=1 Tax=Daphnia magna TaxID=35525 RepID=UPI001E1BB887|nr:dentin sialophosphoprotein isoform X1 [Daphnia magna]